MQRRSIVHQARRYVLVIVVFISAVVIAEWSRLTDLRENIMDLSEATAPLLSETGELARIGSALRTVSQTVAASTDIASLNAVRAELDALIEDASLVLGGNAMPQDLKQKIKDRFAPLFQTQETVITARARLETATSVALGSMENLARELQANHDAALLGQIFEADNRMTPSGLIREIDVLLNTSEMKVSLARLSMSVPLARSDAPANIAQTRAQVIREIGVLASRLSRLEQPALKQSLAEHLSAYSSAMISDDGVMANLATLARAGDERARAQRELASLVDEAIATLAEVSLLASSGFEQAAFETQKTTAALMWQKLTLTLILFLLLATFAWSVVEKGLVSRLAALTQSVRALSNGDISTPIRQTGADEVGEIEEAVERSRITAVALTRSNEELERFAYAAAHDLRSPLRAVADLVEWTQEDFGTDLPKGAQDNLHLISGRVRHLSKHLAALLHYARAGQADKDIATFDLEQFATELRSDFLSDDAFRLVVTNAAGPVELCVTPVKTILLNLVNNAIKHHDRTTGQIELSAHVRDGDIVLHVSDDGPGIPPEHHERVFKLFQTLKVDETGNSTGIGLSLVQKIADNLGGAVRILSDPATVRGTTFELCLPCARPRLAANRAGEYPHPQGQEAA